MAGVSTGGHADLEIVVLSSSVEAAHLSKHTAQGHARPTSQAMGGASGLASVSPRLTLRLFFIMISSCSHKLMAQDKHPACRKRH